MDSESCQTPLAVHGTVSPKSPARSTTASPVDDKSTVLPATDRASPEPNCAICLGKLQNKSFTNSCLHQYCFNCLLEWSKVKAECPLCKQSFQSIIHNVRSIEDYDQYDLLPNETPYHWNFELHEMPRFRYRTTMTGGNHGRLHAEEVNAIYVSLPTASRVPQRLPWTRSRRQIATTDFRRAVYLRNLWVLPLNDITGRYRESSPEFYRNNPAQLNRLVPWLSRELSVLLQNQAHLAVVLDHILNILERHSISSRTMRTSIVSYIGMRHIDHFIHEFRTFAQCPYDMIGFDEMAEYGHHETRTVEIPPSPTSVLDSSSIVVISSDTEDDVYEDGEEDSDGEINVGDNEEMSHALPSGSHPEEQGTTSRIASRRLLADQPHYIPSATENVRRQVSQNLVESSDSDDCVIVGYVKPLHERTPEIVEIQSDEDIIQEREQTHKNHKKGTKSITNVGVKEVHRLDMENPVASTSGSQLEQPDSTAGCSNYIPTTINSSRVRQHRGKKISASRGRTRVRKESVNAIARHSSSSSSPVVRKHPVKLSYSSDSSSRSPIRRRISKGKQLRQFSSSSDSSSSNPPRLRTSRMSHLSKLSYSSDSSSRSPVRHHTSKEREDVRHTSNSGRSSIEDYSYPLASRMPSYNSIYSSDDESTFDSQNRPKLRSIIVPKPSNGLPRIGTPYPSSSSCISARHCEASFSPWSLSSRDRKQKHKSQKHERKKRRRKETLSSSSSEDFTVRRTKRKSENLVIYSDLD